MAPFPRNDAINVAAIGQGNDMEIITTTQILSSRYQCGRLPRYLSNHLCSSSLTGHHAAPHKRDQQPASEP